MDDILALSIDPLMLKKHPHIVETIKRVNNTSNVAPIKDVFLFLRLNTFFFFLAATIYRQPSRLEIKRRRGGKT